ncbi:Polynucleotide 5'-hydroxyl-kinase GRC3 [Erysiphe neolycopersici]|uniref:Polynucleotide 5'-hydroxyl-kinase GRC3 n=1 Tax=Erysiphe neolycopersici TaxID=212602 RepID=A0A420I1Y3_9PEZI|nr:Polynucleotide 5'-hydroxyl-kinase GRC3 [Erysiphe neolycopersici]
MSSSKRRKLSSPSNLQLSAFTARNTLKNKPCDSASQKRNHAYNLKIEKVQADDPVTIDHINETTKEDGPLEQNYSTSIADRPIKLLSTFVPTIKNFKEFEDGSKSLRIVPGDRLVIVGQYEICVRKGEISVLGATLRHSKRYRVFASQTHSLPVIRCPRESLDHADIDLYPFESGFEELKCLSPLFGSLLDNIPDNNRSELENLSRKKNPSRFQILFSSNDQNQKLPYHSLVSPPEWNLAISSCLKYSNIPPIVFVCGPKSTGKSTFAKLLINRFISGSTENLATTGVVLLDLDPGQPEYSPPGQLSLIHVKEPNLGPSFSHPVCGSINKCLRSHSIGAVSPTLDPNFYKTCALNLFSEYLRFLATNNSKCPLVINTPGWVLGTGLEILVELIENIKPKIVIYMSQDGPPEVVESLQDVDKSIKFFLLPSQTSENSSRTAAQLRKMLYMSYFHLNSSPKKTLVWDIKPVTSYRPWEIRYSEESSGILGIVCYGECPPGYLLAETLNGCLVSIVVVDEIDAVPGLKIEKLNLGKEMLGTHEDPMYPDKLPEEPNVIRTPEDLPYFNPKKAITLHPEKSHCIGLALVRGIDVSRRRLQVITPISPSIIEGLQEAEKSIVLVHGKLDTPGWAYTEYLMQQNVPEENYEFLNKPSQIFHNDLNENDTDTYIALESGVNGEQVQDIPWVERLQGHQGRSVGSFVWRVRRDLGKSNDGPDP